MDKRERFLWKASGRRSSKVVSGCFQVFNERVFRNFCEETNVDILIKSVAVVIYLFVVACKDVSAC